MISARTLAAIDYLESAALRCQHAGLSREKVTNLMQQVVDFRRQKPAPEPIDTGPRHKVKLSNPRELTPEANERWANWFANMQRRGYFAEPNTDMRGHT